MLPQIVVQFCSTCLVTKAECLDDAVAMVSGFVQEWQNVQLWRCVVLVLGHRADHFIRWPLASSGNIIAESGAERCLQRKALKLLSW